MLSYRVSLDVPFQLALFVSGLPADHHREIDARVRDPCPDQLEAGGVRAEPLPGHPSLPGDPQVGVDHLDQGARPPQFRHRLGPYWLLVDSMCSRTWAIEDRRR